MRRSGGPIRRDSRVELVELLHGLVLVLLVAFARCLRGGRTATTAFA